MGVSKSYENKNCGIKKAKCIETINDEWWCNLRVLIMHIACLQFSWPSCLETFLTWTERTSLTLCCQMHAILDVFNKTNHSWMASYLIYSNSCQKVKKQNVSSWSEAECLTKHRNHKPKHVNRNAKRLIESAQQHLFAVLSWRLMFSLFKTFNYALAITKENVIKTENDTK